MCDVVTASSTSSVAVIVFAAICALETVPVKSPPTATSKSIVSKAQLPAPSVLRNCPAVPSEKFNSLIPKLSETLLKYSLDNG